MGPTNIYKVQIRSFVGECVPLQETRTCLASKGCLTLKQTDRLTVGLSVTLTLDTWTHREFTVSSFHFSL
jgi:hypothetical protein